MALGQCDASPTGAYLVAAKGVLRYLAGTVHLGLTSGLNTFLSLSSSMDLPVDYLKLTGHRMREIRRVSLYTASISATLLSPGRSENNGQSQFPLLFPNTIPHILFLSSATTRVLVLLPVPMPFHLYET